jgi:hypothetical protein
MPVSAVPATSQIHVSPITTEVGPMSRCRTVRLRHWEAMLAAFSLSLIAGDYAIALMASLVVWISWG